MYPDRPPFAENVYYFNASATALDARWRRPQADEASQGHGKVALSAIAGRQQCLCANPVSLLNGVLTASSYVTEVSGEFTDVDAARALTVSPARGVPNNWNGNRLPARTTVLCAVNGFQAINFTDRATGAGPRLRIERFEFLMDSIDNRKPGGEAEISFSSLYFLGVSINGVAVTIDVDLAPLNDNRTHAQLNAAAKGLGNRAHPAGTPDKQLVTVVRSISCPGAAAAGFEIKGHSIYVPDLGVIYFGEVLSSHSHRRIQMVRIAAGSDGGGELLGGGGSGNGHGYP